MPAGPPRDYDRVHETPLKGPLQIRIGLTTERGRVKRFVVQLEYWINDEWREVVRYDHDPESEMGHDVTEEGLHMDIYRDGKKEDTEYVTGPIPADVAIDTAEEHLSEHLERYVRRFEQWHAIDPRNR